MRTLHYTIHIHTNAQTVWQVLWDKTHYTAWTSIFGEGSYYISDWNIGSTIQFMGNHGNGIYATILENKPYTKMHFEHQGEIKNFELVSNQQPNENWKGANEIYTLTEHNNLTTLEVHIDILEKYEPFFVEAFPKALQKVKEIAELL